MQDIEVIIAFRDTIGGWSEGARRLSTKTTTLTAGHVYNWYRRGRVPPEQRLRFRAVFNVIMPKRRLPLSWLACPAKPSSNNGSKGHGRASSRTKEQAEGQARKGKRRGERAGA